MKRYLEKLIDRRSLSQSETAEAFDLIMSGNATPAQIAATLAGLTAQPDVFLAFSVAPARDDS